MITQISSDLQEEKCDFYFDDLDKKLCYKVEIVENPCLMFTFCETTNFGTFSMEIFGAKHKKVKKTFFSSLLFLFLLQRLSKISEIHRFHKNAKFQMFLVTFFSGEKNSENLEEEGTLQLNQIVEEGKLKCKFEIEKIPLNSSTEMTEKYFIVEHGRTKSISCYSTDQE